MPHSQRAASSSQDHSTSAISGEQIQPDLRPAKSPATPSTDPTSAVPISLTPKRCLCFYFCLYIFIIAGYLLFGRKWEWRRSNRNVISAHLFSFTTRHQYLIPMAHFVVSIFLYRGGQLCFELAKSEGGCVFLFSHTSRNKHAGQFNNVLDSTLVEKKCLGEMLLSYLDGR